MTPEEHFDSIRQTLDYVATLQRSHDEQIGKLVEQSDRNEKETAALRETMAERSDALDARVDALGGHVGVLTEQVGVLTEQLSVLAGRVADLTGHVETVLGHVGMMAGYMNTLSERMLQAADAITHLGGVAGNHEQRLVRLESPR